MQNCLELLEKQKDLKKKLKDSQNDLGVKLEKKYPKLKEEEIKVLVVEDKWLTQLSFCVKDELDRISHSLTSRISELAKRYAMSLPKLNTKVENLSKQVEDHLNKMGYYRNKDLK